MRATATVACPHCGTDTKATVGADREVTDVTTSREFVYNVLEKSSLTSTTCPDGHRFYVEHEPKKY
jgi:hypothetical protein